MTDEPFTLGFSEPTVPYESASQSAHTTTSWTWLSAGRYHFGLTLLTDQLSVFMMLIGTSAADEVRFRAA